MTRGRWAAVLVVGGMLMAGIALAQQQPANPPASRPALSPRDALPFTNSSLNNINPNLPTLFITGDSTAATGNPGTRGWAALLIDYFDASKINLVNRGIGGARFNSYMAQYWDPVMAAIKPGDFVVIEFGHNSGPLPGIGEETQGNMHTHGWYLRKFINDVREHKGIPIASTIDGKVERLKEQQPGQGGMSDWTRQVAGQEKVFLVDHGNIIADRYDAMGQEAAHKFFTATPTEYLHTNTTGAIVNCEAFIAGLRALPEAPLDKYLNEKGKAIAPYKPAK
jgi:rhamnogalacturonan acetylesterase